MDFENRFEYTQTKNRDKKEKYAGIALCLIIIFVFQFYLNSSDVLLFTQIVKALGVTIAVVLFATIFTLITQYFVKLKTHYLFAFYAIIISFLMFLGKHS